jgi:DNA-binding transcriptional MerR regulator
MEKLLPSIPAKRYFTIGEVSDLCGVKPYVLRYWEQEFTQLKPMKRRGNRRYYQHHEVLLIRRIRELLYDQGFTISGARNRLLEMGQFARPDDAESQVAEASSPVEPMPGLFAPDAMEASSPPAAAPRIVPSSAPAVAPQPAQHAAPMLVIEPPVMALREELIAIRALLLD